MTNFDFLDRASSMLRERFSDKVSLRRAAQDNESFGDAFVEARVPGGAIRLRRERGELIAEIARGREALHHFQLTDESLQDNEANLRMLLERLVEALSSH
jgi:hypothetical protein